MTAMSFTPEELTEAIRKVVPAFEVTYEPDSRQQIGRYYIGVGGEGVWWSEAEHLCSSSFTPEIVFNDN